MSLDSCDRQLKLTASDEYYRQQNKVIKINQLLITQIILVGHLLTHWSQDVNLWYVNS